MRRSKPVALITVLLLLAPVHGTIAGSGFATRDLNPMLQALYLPSHAPASSGDGWRIDHSFYITNTFQEKTRGDERLIIDVENYRYELGLRYRRDNWQAQANIPFLANSAGELDGLIEDWHELFGFPNGKRDRFPQDDLVIEYLRDGVVEYSQTSSSSGLGDTSLAIGYQPAGEIVYFAGIELPTGSESDFSGNDSIDIALWLSRESQINDDINGYGLIGISFPGDDGNLEGLVVDHIWVAQLGFDYRFSDGLIATVQLDAHSKTIDGSDLKAFGNSLQIQLGLGFLELFEAHRLDLFFSEDIVVGSAPDISFGIRLAREF